MDGHQAADRISVAGRVPRVGFCGASRPGFEGVATVVSKFAE